MLLASGGGSQSGAAHVKLLDFGLAKLTTLADPFFFQAEDGIRDKLVTGAQTCALPICAVQPVDKPRVLGPLVEIGAGAAINHGRGKAGGNSGPARIAGAESEEAFQCIVELVRSEERRVGKECRRRWVQEH